MVQDNIAQTITIVNFGINTIFMILSLLILWTFLNRFEGNIDYRKPNILGFILMALGLSFHILGNLLITLLVGSNFYEQGFNHFLKFFISLSVVMFVVGTVFILYHIVSENNKSKVKLFGYLYLVVGLFESFLHLTYYFTKEPLQILGIDLNTFSLAYVIFAMVFLTIIYILMLVQSRRSPSKIISVRYSLLGLTAIGFVLVIIVDGLAQLNQIDFGDVLTFVIFFVLHVITVGALYLLVLFPPWFQKWVGIDDI